MRASVLLPPVPESAAAARSFVERTLRAWGYRELIDNARVVVTELVSNVVRHAGTETRLDVEVEAGTVRIRVADRADGRVVVRSADPRSDVDGRGLRLVEELSERWGVEERPGSKAVWAEWRTRVPSRDPANA